MHWRLLHAASQCYVQVHAVADALANAIADRIADSGADALSHAIANILADFRTNLPARHLSLRPHAGQHVQLHHDVPRHRQHVHTGRRGVRLFGVHHSQTNLHSADAPAHVGQRHLFM